MSCPGGSLTKTVYSTVFPHKPTLVRAVCMHTRMKRERGGASSNAILRHLSIKSNFPRSIAPLSASHSPAGAACSCTFVKVKRAEAAERRERKRWMAGEVLLMCAGPLTLPDKDLTKPKTSNRNTDKPLFGSYMSESQIF